MQGSVDATINTFSSKEMDDKKECLKLLNKWDYFINPYVLSNVSGVQTSNLNDLNIIILLLSKAHVFKEHSIIDLNFLHIPYYQLRLMFTPVLDIYKVPSIKIIATIFTFLISALKTLNNKVKYLV